jgi:polysaccharide biosynthesis/export protein
MPSAPVGFWSFRRPFASYVAALALAAVAAGCAPKPAFVWVDSLPPAPRQQTETYVIHDGDLIDIHVLNEERMTGKVRVRTDGQVTLPMLGDLPVRGKTPLALAHELEVNLARFIKEPTVSVGVDETHPLSVTVLGEVAHPGVFVLPTNAGVMQALASAGGLTEFASHDSIYVLQPKRNVRVRFDYEALLGSEPKAIGFVLLDGDVVAVE